MIIYLLACNFLPTTDSRTYLLLSDLLTYFLLSSSTHVLISDPNPGLARRGCTPGRLEPGGALDLQEPTHERDPRRLVTICGRAVLGSFSRLLWRDIQTATCARTSVRLTTISQTRKAVDCFVKPREGTCAEEKRDRSLNTRVLATRTPSIFLAVKFF